MTDVAEVSLYPRSGRESLGEGEGRDVCREEGGTCKTKRGRARGSEMKSDPRNVEGGERVDVTLLLGPVWFRTGQCFFVDMQPRKFPFAQILSRMAPFA